MSDSDCPGGLDFDQVADMVGELAALAFFPTDPAGRLSVQKIIGKMATSIDQVRWLVDTMLAVYNKWPGPAEMRVVFCHVYRPKDGINANYSGVFPDGDITLPQGLPLPSGRRVGELEAAPPVKALPAGESAADESEAVSEVDTRPAIAELARATRFPVPARRLGPQVISVPSHPPFKPITQADIEAAVKANWEAKARAARDSDSRTG